jgi:hypothetical protein
LTFEPSSFLSTAKFLNNFASIADVIPYFIVGSAVNSLVTENVQPD